MFLERLGLSDEILLKYKEAAEKSFDDDFVSKDFALKNADEAQLTEEHKKLISDFFDYISDDVKHYIWLYYYILFKTDEDFLANIWDIESISKPVDVEKKFPGCIYSVTYILAAENLRQWIRDNDMPPEMMDQFYERYRHFSDLNIISHQTPAFCRLSAFVYGYAKPFIFCIERLQFQYIYFKDYCELYENKMGKRVFVALPNYTYNEKGLQDKDGNFVPGYEKIENKLYGHLFKKNGTLSLKAEELDLNEYKLMYKPTDKMFTIHIPEKGGKLTKEVVRETLRKANTVLRKHFPEFKTFVCQTWFIDPALRGEIVKDGSNMADFADIFDIICGPDNDNHSVFEHVFKTVRKPLNELIPENDFQRRILERAKRGEKIYWSYGVLKEDYDMNLTSELN